MSGFGNPKINQVFGLLNEYNAGNFLQFTGVAEGVRMQLGLASLPPLNDGMVGTMVMVCDDYPSLVGDGDSLYEGSPDYGFLNCQHSFKFSGTFLRTQLKPTTDFSGTGRDGAFTTGTYTELSDWLADPVNLGGASEELSGEFSPGGTGFTAHDDRGWVYIDDDEDGYGMGGDGTAIIRGNIDMSSLKETLVDNTELGDLENAENYTGYYFNFSEIQHHYMGPRDLEGKTGQDPPYTDKSAHGILMWQCQITNFYDTYMNDLSIFSYPHLVADEPVNKGMGFLNNAGAGLDYDALAGMTPMNAAQAIADEFLAAGNTILSYYKVNDNITLDYENCSILPISVDDYENPPSFGNPTITHTFGTGDQDPYYGTRDLSLQVDTDGSGLLFEDRYTDGQTSEAEPSLNLYLNSPAYGSVETVIDKYEARYKARGPQFTKFRRWRDHIVGQLQTTTYDSVTSKKFVVKMQNARTLSKQELYALQAEEISYAEDFATAPTTMASTDVATSAPMSATPASMGSSGYGGY